MRSTPCLLLLLFAACGPSAAQVQSGPYRGRHVQSVLDELRAAGVPLVYSSNLVSAALLIEQEPTSREPRALAQEILAPHHLVLRESLGVLLIVRGEAPESQEVVPGAIVVELAALPGSVLKDGGEVYLDAPAGSSAVFVSGRAQINDLLPGRHALGVSVPGYLPERVSANVQPGEVTTVSVALVEAAPRLDEMAVTASRYDLIREIQPSATVFSRDEIEALSEFGDDPLRIAHRLPGIAAGEFSARSHVRGGAANESSVIFEGMRLVEPFHLRDYQSLFSAIDQRVVSGIEIYSGGFPAKYGDSLSGLTVIEQRESTELHHELGLSLLYTSALTSGTFRNGKGTWLASVRRGNVDSLLNAELGEPSYSDGFVHVATTVGGRHRFVINALGFDDDITLRQGDRPGAREEGRSETDTSQIWLKLDSDWSDKFSSSTLLYLTHFTADRYGMVDDVTELLGAVRDRRTQEGTGVKQDWEWQPTTRQFLSFGAEVGQVDGTYLYSSSATQLGLLASIGIPPPPRNFALAPGGNRYSAYLSDRVRLTDRLVADVGVRWDRQTYLPPNEDEQFSPRASLLYRLRSRTDLRLSYGRFFQAEGLLDLQVEDGVLDFVPAQNATHSIGGVEHRFDNDVMLRVELFRKRTHNVRSRYENLFDPLELLPELRPGRVRVSPELADARGVDVFLSGERPVSWWASYSAARVEDVLGGERVPRAWDQRHAVGGGLSLDAGQWTLSFAATLRTGWPVTTVELQTVPGPSGAPQMVAVVGKRNAERLDSLRRFDFRASKAFVPMFGSLRFFAEVANVADRDNLCCIAYEQGVLPDGREVLNRVDREGFPLTANVGLLWEF